MRINHLWSEWNINRIGEHTYKQMQAQTQTIQVHMQMQNCC